jgi:hypothetical protein
MHHAGEGIIFATIEKQKPTEKWRYARICVGKSNIFPPKARPPAWRGVLSTLVDHHGDIQHEAAVLRNQRVDAAGDGNIHRARAAVVTGRLRLRLRPHRPTDISFARFFGSCEAQTAVTIDSHHYALPFDTYSWLSHINLDLMKRAGLVASDGTPLLPHSPAQLLKTMYEEGLTTRGQDYGAALQSFAAGEGAVMINGTWIIGDLLRRSRQAGDYTAVPFPRLYAHDAVWADNHVMVLLKGGTPDARSRHAALALLKFSYDEGGVWSRTGQLPTRRSVIGSPAFTRLPLRREIAAIARDGVALPIEVARQAIVAKTLGDAMIALIAYGADPDITLARAGDGLQPNTLFVISPIHFHHPFGMYSRVTVMNT